MAVKKEATIQRYIGLSTDTKPTSVPIGTTFYEYDSKLLYITYDGTNYVIKDLDYGLLFAGTCNSGMTASATTIACADLAGYGNDYFNGLAPWYMQVVKNSNAVTSAPSGEIRVITDYVSATGTFTVDAFSANVEEDDEVIILHPSIIAIFSTQTELDYFILADMDDFDVADADADTERWTPGYITGTEGGSADINTTTSGQLMVKVDPDATPTEARYGVAHALPLYADYMTVIVDLDCTWGAGTSASARALGMILSKGTTYDGQNYLALERQKGTGINRFTVSGKLNNVAISATNSNTTDDAVALKIERWDNTWRLYSSTAQYPNYAWTLLAQVEDASVYMTNQVTLFLEAYSPGSADTESAQGDFDSFRYYIGAGGGGQFIAGDYSSAWVSNDVDGSVFERLEAIQQALSVVAAAGGEFEADGSTDLWDALVVDSSADANIVAMTGNRDGAVIERLAALANALGITDAATLTGYEEDGTGASLFKTLVAVQSVTTGAGTTTTITDTARTEGADYWNDNIIVILSGSAAGQAAVIVDDNGTNTLTLRPPLTAAPGASAVYVILKQLRSPVPAADSTDNYGPGDVIGNKTDAVDYTYSATASSIIALVKGILGTAVIAEGTLTTSSQTVPADTGRLEASDYWNGSWLMPVTGSAAFQPRLIVDFTVTTGVFTIDPEQVFNAATGLVAYVILSPNSQLVPAANSANNNTPAHVIGNKTDAIPAMNAAPGNDSIVAHAKAILERVGATPNDSDDSVLTDLGQRDDAATADTMADITTTSIMAKLRLILNRLSTDAFTATIQGAARTALDTMLAQLATYISPGGAAYSVTINNVAKADLETTIEALATIIGCDGANIFNPTVEGVAQTTVEAAFTAVGDGIDVLQADLGDASGASTTVYDQVKHINKTAIDVTIPPVANTLADILHKDGSYTYDNTSDSLEAISTRIDVPTANSANNLQMRDVVGAKDDDPNFSIGSTHSLTRYIKALIQSGMATESYVNDGAATTASFITALTEATDDHYNGMLLFFYRVSGGANSGQAHVISNYIGATKTVEFATGDQWTDAPANTDRFVILPAPGAYLIKIFNDLAGATGLLHEQADTAVTITAIAASETNVFDLSTASTRYIVRNLRLKAADPGVQILTIKLYELINDVLTVVDTATITTANFTTYFGLVDMFGMNQLAGDNLKITVQMDGGAGCAVTGQYSHAKTNV